ncbi:MAG: hypothetical protein MK110_07670 [Fuerstiella sp.]|nr:hypothetical protein [Fuerstiella sp.]
MSNSPSKILLGTIDFRLEAIVKFKLFQNGEDQGFLVVRNVRERRHRLTDGISTQPKLV